MLPAGFSLFAYENESKRVEASRVLSLADRTRQAEAAMASASAARTRQAEAAMASASAARTQQFKHSHHREYKKMGFGIALLGYGCFALYEIGGGVLAAPLLAYGFFLASRLEKHFMMAAVSALFLLPRGILQFLIVLGVFDVSDIPVLNTATYIVHLCAWMLMSYFWLTSVINIARNCNAPKLERTAQNRLVLTIAFVSLSLAAGLLNMFGVLGGIAYTVTSIQFILQYIVIFANIFFLHTCFVLITSEKQYAKDKQQLAKEQNEALKKMEQKRAARQEKFDRRRKK